MAVLDAGAERLEPNGEGGFAVCVLCVFLQSIGLPVFPTGAIVVVCTERENMISLDPGLPLGWEGITDPCFTKYSLRVCPSALHTIARCPPGLYGKLHEQYCLICLTHHVFSLLLIPVLLALEWPRGDAPWVYLQGELGRSATGRGRILHAISLHIICAFMKL